MKNNQFPKILSVLKDLHKAYPTLSIARHISDATAEYESLWGVSDKELLYALECYQEELKANQPPSEDEIEKITREAMDLEHFFDDEEEDDF